MSRYFDRFDVMEPLVELTPEQAASRGSYLLEEIGPPRHFQGYLRHRFSRVIYPEMSHPAPAVADFLNRYRGQEVRLDVFSPVEAGPGWHGYTWWRYDENGVWKNTLRSELLDDSADYRDYRLDADGNVLGHITYVHDDTGELIQRLHHDASGALLRREWVD